MVFVLPTVFPPRCLLKCSGRLSTRKQMELEHANGESSRAFQGALKLSEGKWSDHIRSVQIHVHENQPPRRSQCSGYFVKKMLIDLRTSKTTGILYSLNKLTSALCLDPQNSQPSGSQWVLRAVRPKCRSFDSVWNEQPLDGSTPVTHGGKVPQLTNPTVWPYQLLLLGPRTFNTSSHKGQSTTRTGPKASPAFGPLASVQLFQNPISLPFLCWLLWFFCDLFIWFCPRRRHAYLVLDPVFGPREYNRNRICKKNMVHVQYI